jgi:hypothetical protein
LRARALPVSVLKPMPGLTYSKIKGAPEVMPEMKAKAEFWEGMITRQISRQSTLAGTVQLMRVRPGVITDKAWGDGALREIIAEFAQTKEFTEVQISGQDVLLTKKARDTGGSVAGWLDGRDFILLLARPGLSAQKLATTYINGE